MVMHELTASSGVEMGGALPWRWLSTGVSRARISIIIRRHPNADVVQMTLSASTGRVSGPAGTGHVLCWTFEVAVTRCDPVPRMDAVTGHNG